MPYFMETSNTIPEGLGFAHFGAHHFLELGILLVLCVLCALVYRRGGERVRRSLRRSFALLLILDELFKHTMLLIGGHWGPEYLPLHLCSVNIFVIAYHAWRPSKAVSNFLYCICLPAALAALLFPGWSELPPENFMHLHSYSVHVLLAIYPLMLLVGGEVSRNPRQIPLCLLILLGLAGVALGANLLFDTNFMFLMYSPAGNPLGFFEKLLGSHLFGFPIIMTGVLLLAYCPLPKHRRKAAV